MVTVPPQALGISPAGVEPSAAASPAATTVPPPPSLPPTAAVVATPPSDVLPPPTPPPAISSRTMEQLAEFDSILESKFQYNNNTGSNNSLLLQGSSNSITMIKSEAVEPTTAAAGDVVIGPVPETPLLR